MILITGATDGIGLETAKALAMQGHALVLHGRSEEKAEHARNVVLGAAPNAAVQTVSADLANLAAVTGMAAKLLDRLSELDVLVNNAGVYMMKRELTRDGAEMTIGVNHLSHFLLTNLLLPLLKRSADPRVVTVSSVAHMSGRINFDNMNGERGYDAYHAYANSKLANALFAFELARRAQHLCSNCLHPGVIDTKLLHAGFSMEGAPVAEGARTSVYLASSPQVKGVTGQYFDRCAPASPSALALDADLARRLWDWSENFVRPHLPS